VRRARAVLQVELDAVDGGHLELLDAKAPGEGERPEPVLPRSQRRQERAEADQAAKLDA